MASPEDAKPNTFLWNIWEIIGKSFKFAKKKERKKKSPFLKNVQTKL